MPHVSKQKIKKDLFDELFSELITLQTGLTKQNAVRMADALLTDTEKVMLTKRCAAVLMFHRGCSMYRVWSVLKISPSTAARIQMQYESGKYEGLIHVFDKRKRDREKFWKTLEIILRAGMPSMGKDRWKWLDDLN